MLKDIFKKDVGKIKIGHSKFYVQMFRQLNYNMARELRAHFYFI